MPFSPAPGRVALGGVVAIVAVVLVVVLIMGVTIGVTETVCRGPAASTTENATWHTVLAPEERRNEVDSYITYPEWSIVYAYDGLNRLKSMSITGGSDVAYTLDDQGNIRTATVTPHQA